MTQRKIKILGWLVGWFCLLFFIALIACKKQAPLKQSSYFHTQIQIFKTNGNIKYFYHKELGKEIMARLDSFDLSMNPFNNKSVIYKVNNNIDVEVDDWFITCFKKAQELAILTDGMYDITSAPLINLWGFGFNKMDEATPEKIDSLKQFVGYDKIYIEGRKVIKKDPRVQLNMSSIAKGYSCDILADLFDSYGIENYMIEIGGEIRVKGKNPNGKYWSIGITTPIDNRFGDIKETQEILSLENCALATSGNYRNFYIKDGKKYSHTINPKTGYPSEGNLLSVSILAPDCMTADAFATAFMVVGLEQSEEIASKIDNLDYLFIFADSKGNMKELRSSNFTKYTNLPK